MPPNEAQIARPRGYRDESVCLLVRLAAESGDREAIDEILRRALILEGKSRMPIHEYIELVCRRCSPQSAWKSADDLRSEAYDLAIARFHNQPGHTDVDSSGPDCRYQYRAVLAMADGQREEVPFVEERVLAALKRCVLIHTRLCIREAQRSANPHIHRYRFEHEAGAVTLWMPRHMKGEKKRQWLQKRFPEHPPAEEMQRIVDRELNAAAPVVTKNELREQARASALNPKDSISGESLADIVSKEKASAIRLLPPSIGKLGPDRVRGLILEIFAGIGDPDYNAREVAQRFGLSPSALTRFAGTKWNEQDFIDAPKVPVLWRNCAKVLAASEEFRFAAQAAGVWKRVEAIATNDGESSDGNA